ncbi:uncharacterized protein BYT42DRAFT_543333 [Radiomyces spectabilis]|uniref:uncharacterized protein n=1 Tax=Radiomyces spectabilis TaxID=64574 RepID=UPI00221FF314|nr:uncharacterized protein BYT42DRAFT_543333 [Radiomyces spectabilis]KAI8387943.1 hypothetical protein BYT42DRAFT_543333 [Radiomyces spectabilis]
MSNWTRGLYHLRKEPTGLNPAARIIGSEMVVRRTQREATNIFSTDRFRNYIEATTRFHDRRSAGDPSEPKVNAVRKPQVDRGRASFTRLTCPASASQPMMMPNDW